jgi:hypothetical protein
VPPQDPKYSQAVVFSEIAHTVMPVSAHLGWDSFWRLAYEKADILLQKQANELLRRGNITLEEARALVDQRNKLVIDMRKPLSPFGKFYSEALKPSTKLPQLSELLAKKKTIEAVLVSVGKSRAVTNRFAFIWRRAGPAGIVLEIVATAVVIQKAPSSQRNEVIAEQSGRVVGGLAGGRVGMWGGALAGAAWAGTWAAPTLVIPVVGPITEGTAIILGGIIGGLLVGWVGQEAGGVVAHQVWQHLPIEWR